MIFPKSVFYLSVPILVTSDDHITVDSSSDEAASTPMETCQIINPTNNPNAPKLQDLDLDASPPPAKKQALTKKGVPRVTKHRAPPPLNTLSAIRGPPLSSEQARKIMWDQYNPWVMGTYGDAAKTKTITTKKYARIVALLRSISGGGGGGGGGHPSCLDKDGNVVVQPHETITTAGATGTGSSSEAAKFKLWVKSKGFHLGPPHGHQDIGLTHTLDMLYLPTGTDKVRVIRYTIVTILYAGLGTLILQLLCQSHNLTTVPHRAPCLAFLE
jgi:hypothetical protein